MPSTYHPPASGPDLELTLLRTAHLCWQMAQRAAKTDAASRRQGGELWTSGRGERVLVVEDDARIARVNRSVLEEAGYVTVHAQGNAPSLVVTDVIMPRMSGLQLFRELRAQGRPVRMLICSGHQPAGLEEVVHSSCTAVLNKPYAPQELLQSVRRLLDEPAPH